MQEYHDGSFGEIKELPEIAKLFERENSEDLEKTKAIYFGTVEDLREIKNKSGGAFGSQSTQEKDGTSVKEYLCRVEYKLDMIIKHFNIVRIIG